MNLDGALIKLVPQHAPGNVASREGGKGVRETRKVDVRLPGKRYSNPHGARPVHLVSRADVTCPAARAGGRGLGPNQNSIVP